MNSADTMFLYFLVVIAVPVSGYANATVDEPIPEYYATLAQGNSLWTALLKNCRQPTMDCVKKSMHDYLDEALDSSEDFQLAPFLKFTKNRMDFDGDFDGGSDDEPRSAIEEVSRELRNKSVRFLMTHDVELRLPETFFEGARLRVAPRALEEDGAVVKLELLPKEVAEGRIFKKIKQFISEKLIYALMAILLIIKLLAAKFMFFMPMMVGAVTAKKLLIKVLLFLFPALHHLFKLCAYVPHGHKFHHHKHQIAHIHHIAHGHKHHKHHHHHPPHDGLEIIHPHAEGPPIVVHDDDHGHEIHGHHSWSGPSLHHHAVEFETPDKDFFNPHEQELQFHSGGPALTHHFLTHRQDSSEDDNEVQPFRKKPKRPLTPTEIEQAVLKAEREAMLKARLQQERLKIQEENARLQEQLRQAMKLQEKLKQQAAAMKAKLPQLVPPPPPPNQYLQTPEAKPVTETKHIYSAQKKQEVVEVKKKNVEESQVKKPTAFEEALQKAASITYDPFYSPILEKIDKILIGLGFKDEPCRERLICSMYKNPVKFSPHSNLLSAELSRDSKELQKPTTTNAAVVRFYRYVQAARDGQDKRECLRLYPSCAINTEQ